MRPLRYSINVTLDGCCDHTAVQPDGDMHRYSAEIIAQADALIFGRKIYELMEDAWREPAETGIRPDWMADWMMPFAQTIHAAKKYVVTNSLKAVSWNAEIIRGNELEQTIRLLKQMPGQGLYVGGLTLPFALAKLGLIDEYEFIVHPVIAGRGPTLFAGLPQSLDLKPQTRREFQSGAVATKYRPVSTSTVRL